MKGLNSGYLDLKWNWVWYSYRICYAHLTEKIPFFSKIDFALPTAIFFQFLLKLQLPLFLLLRWGIQCFCISKSVEVCCTSRILFHLSLWPAYKTSSSFKIVFALSMLPYFHSTYLVRVCRVMTTAVSTWHDMWD